MAKFNPKDHLMPVKGGAQYLEVKWRLVWFREDWPNGVMETEPVEITPQQAIFKATVTAVDADGVKRGSATGYKTCTPSQFKFGYVEKAETGALGRALACLGYGTQFEPEFDEGDLLADSPVQANVPTGATTTAPNAPKPPTPSVSTGSTIASADGVVVAQTRHIDATQLDREKVMRALHATGKDHGIDHAGLSALLKAKGHDSMSTAPVMALVELGTAIKAKPDDLKQWLAKQAELLPSEQDVPNPDRFTA